VKEWDKANHKYPEDLASIPGAIGVDLSTSQDITSWVASWFVNGVLHLQPHFYIPKENIDERVRNSKITGYKTWGEKENLHKTIGNSVDYQQVTDDILKFTQAHNIEAVYYDRHKWSSVIGGLKLKGLNCIAHGQGFPDMNSPCHEFERLVMTHNVNCPNPIFRWMISHCAVETNKGGEIRLVKPEHKNHFKIDGIVAAVMTVSHHTAVKQRIINWKI
jgi:phage terminase large subunit-like protein